jgi:hypothetical protein
MYEFVKAWICMLHYQISPIEASAFPERIGDAVEDACNLEWSVFQ